MIIILHSSQNLEYMIEVLGDETIDDIKDILLREYHIKKESYLVNYQDFFNVPYTKRLNDLELCDGSVLTMDFSSIAVEIENSKNIEKQNDLSRVLLPPKTTYTYNNAYSHLHKDKYDDSLYDDPNNIDELISQVMAIGVSHDIALKALRLANYNITEASLLIDEDSLDDDLKTENNSKPKQINKVINRIPHKWLEKLTINEQAAITRLFKKYGIEQTVYDVFIACEFNEITAEHILSQYCQ